jgi:heterokaryon incompatibility protein (HET)
MRCVSNQDDNEERAQQVQLMRDIYRSAGAIILYLGELTEEDMNRLQLLLLLDTVSEEIQPDTTQPAGP